MKWYKYLCYYLGLRGSREECRQASMESLCSEHGTVHIMVVFFAAREKSVALCKRVWSAFIRGVSQGQRFFTVITLAITLRKFQYDIVISDLIEHHCNSGRSSIQSPA